MADGMRRPLRVAAGLRGSSDRAPLSRLASALLGTALLLLPAGCTRGTDPRLVVIGLDGATWDLLEPWMAAGDLPNLKTLRDGGQWGAMQSVMPYLSPPAWTSAITGVNPGRHGIFDFQRRLPGQTVIVTETAKSRRSPPIWNLLQGSGKKVAIINVPMTDPPDQVDGVMVAGFPHLDQQGFAWPPELEERCTKMGYILDEMEMKLPPGQEEAILSKYAQARDKRWELARQLYQEQEYDLFWIVFTGVDRIQHLYWIFDDPKNPKYDPELARRFADTIHQFWKDQDRILGEFLGLIRPGSTILVISDHGFGPIRRELRVGNWIRAAASGFSSDEARQVFPLDLSDAARLYVRLPGRDPAAELTPAQSRLLRDRLQSGLSAAVDPSTGEKVAESIYPAEQIFVGKYAEKGPDLNCLPSYGYYFSWGDMKDEYKLPVYGPLTSTLSGWHRMDGVFILRGPGVVPGKSDRTYSLLDVAPTCLYLLGRPIAEDFDGSVMEGCFDSGWRKKHPLVRKGLLNEEDRPLTPEEQRALKNLPYVGG